MPEAVQLLIYGTLMGAVGVVWRLLNGRIDTMAAEMKAMHLIIINLQEKNGDLEDENKWLRRDRDSYKRFYRWFRDAYHAMGGTENPPPFDDTDDIAKEVRS